MGYPCSLHPATRPIMAMNEGTPVCKGEADQRVPGIIKFTGWFTRRGFVFVNLQSCAIHALLEMRVNIWHPGCFPSRGTICIVDCNIAQG